MRHALLPDVCASIDDSEPQEVSNLFARNNSYVARVNLDVPGTLQPTNKLHFIDFFVIYGIDGVDSLIPQVNRPAYHCVRRHDSKLPFTPNFDKGREMFSVHAQKI